MAPLHLHFRILIPPDNFPLLLSNHLKNALSSALFDTLSIDKKHNSQNVLHVVTKAHILFQLTLNRE